MRYPGWARRRVLVTGHTGFVGSWLSVLLLEVGAEVSGVSLPGDPVTDARSGWLQGLGVRPLDGDIKDFEAVRRAVGRSAPDVVVHLAAQPIVRTGYADPHGTLLTNIVGSINVLEAVRRGEAGALVHVTSDKCYRNHGHGRPFQEPDEVGAGCPYSTSKAAAEIVFAGYARLLGRGGDPAIASVRLGNVVGGGDLSDRLVPNCLRALAAGEPVELRDGGRSIRPWQHVLDVAHGLVLLGDGLLAGRIGSGEVFNFAPPHQGTTVAELVKSLAAAWGAEPVGFVEGAGDFPEEPLLLLDGRKAMAALGWRHRYDVDAIAGSAVAWHRAVEAGTPAAAATLGQVRSFLASVGAG